MIPLLLKDVVRATGATCRPGDPEVRVMGVATDSRAVREGDLFIAIVGQRLDGHDFLADAFRNGAAAAVVTSGTREGRTGIPAERLIEVPDTVHALGRLAAWYRREVMDRRTRVVGVTGSNGKTTTKLMIDHVLSADLMGRASIRSFNNAIGVPLTLLSAEQEDDYLVVEIGSNAPGEIDNLARITRPDAAVITSIGAAHLAGLGSIEGIAAEKAAILHHVRAAGMAAVNIDEAAILPHLPVAAAAKRHRDRVRGEVKAFPGAGVRAGRRGGVDGALVAPGDGAEVSTYRLCTVGRSPQADLCVADVEGDLDGTSFVLDGDLAVRLRLPGPHHATNAALTYAVARWMGLSAEVIAERLYDFQPAAGRTRRIDLGEVTIIDDCYNANPSSMRAALEILSSVRGRRRVFVMGDMMELGPASELWHRRIGQAAAQAGVELMIAAGRFAQAAAEAGAAGGVPEVVLCDDSHDASELALQRIADGDVVLVKGSRAARLEVVIERLEAALAPQEFRQAV